MKMEEFKEKISELSKNIDGSLELIVKIICEQKGENGLNEQIGEAINDIFA